MQALAARDILELWDGHDGSAATTALAILAAADPDVSREELAALDVGERNRRLLEVRRGLFGDWLRARVTCTACSAELELDLDVSALTDVGSCAAAQLHELQRDSLQLRFRLPTSADLIAVEASPDDAAARGLLIARCIVEAERDGRVLAATELSETEVVHLADGMAAVAPRAEILLDCRCAACGHEWQVVFDIVSFLVDELGTLARRLVSEVHVLALGYGWSEAEVLAMSARRRLAYLEMLGA